MLYDAGAKWPGGDAGRTTVLPVLRAVGVHKLDLLMLSHADADHSGGAASLISELPIGSLIGPKTIFGSQADAIECHGRLEWRWDNIHFRVLHPAGQRQWSDNDSSCVLLISDGKTQIILSGDIESAAEEALLASKTLPNAELVLVPHHGSKTSSSRPFVHALTPSYAVFSTGYANRWHFPAPEIVARWVNSGACALSTATSGALEFVSTPHGLVMSRAQRASLTRPWPLRSHLAGQCLGTINRMDAAL